MRIVITGSSSGIGHALVRHLVQHGHEVWGLARRDQTEDVARFAPRFRATRCDVSIWSSVADAARQVHAEWPTVDGLITCAGWQGAIGPATEADPAQWSATVRTNLDSTFFAIRAFWNGLRNASRRGKVVCFSGGGATRARPNFSAYGVAKTAVVRLVETIAAEETAAPVDLNAVAPGAIGTPMTEAIVSAGPARAGEREFHAARQRLESPDEAPLNRAIALVEWLLSPSSDGIRGRLISAAWDPWPDLAERRHELTDDIYTLRRILPEDRGRDWSRA